MRHLYFPILAGGCMFVSALHAQNERPNIVFIMADDLGWNDLGITGSDYYETPNIDKLASEGVFFDNAYAAAANSAPSRACFMTGLYTPRHGVYTVSPSARGDKTKRKLIPITNTEDVRTDFVTLGEALKQQGYVCGHIGKWHLGSDLDGSKTGPLLIYKKNISFRHAVLLSGDSHSFCRVVIFLYGFHNFIRQLPERCSRNRIGIQSYRFTCIASIANTLYNRYFAQQPETSLFGQLFRPFPSENIIFMIGQFSRSKPGHIFHQA